MKAKLLISLSLLLLPLHCYANGSDDLLHETAHFGAVYAITHATDVMCKKVVGTKHKWSCALVGASLANIANVAYKANEGFPKDTERSLISGAAGSGLALIVIRLDF